jgi:alpha-glucosidase
MRKRDGIFLPAVLILCILSIVFLEACSKQETATVDGPKWWKNAVFYEIYPRSFADSNNDGIGDLNGITSKLDYLKDLGVDAIWISPCYPSPQVDFGYDVSDYQNIDPMYGTLEDFDRLAAEAKKRGIRIIMDFVMNHTSDQHKWFLDSKSSKSSPYRDWYIWRDGKNGAPPNNWTSTFGGPAWKLDPTTGQYYYHYFYPEQPDLNWRNPDVKKAMFDVTRFWHNRGVSGFRLDAVDTLYEDPALPDNPVLPGKNVYGDPNTEKKYTVKLPEVHDTLRELRKVVDEYDGVLVGETWTSDVAELKEYYGEKNDELQLPMNFLFTMVNKLSAPEFRKQIALIESTGKWPVYVISNHDIVRSANRYGDGKNNDAIAKMMAGFYLTLRGTAVMYYGEELGMENNNPKRREDVKDPIGKLGWPKEIGRDGERTPMQWDTSTYAGFSQVKPWLPVPPSYKAYNVGTESKDPDSVLQFYKKVIALRKSHPALQEGNYVPLNEDDPSVISYLRQSKDNIVLVAINMSGAQQSVSFDLSKHGIAVGKVTPLLTSGTKAGETSGLVLPPFAVYIGEVQRK